MFADARISRKDFLKLLGAGGTVFLFGWLAQGSLSSVLQKYGGNTNNNNNNQVQEAYAQSSSGSWLPVTSSTSAVAIHSALTSAGKIFYLAGSGWDLDRRNGPYPARLLDPVTGTDTNVPLSKDLFCAGQCQLPNGNILLTGGTAQYDADINNCNGRWHGARFAYEFDVNTGTLVEQAPMNTGRWYPTLVTLPDGKVIVVSGLDDYGSYNYLAEMYDPVTKSWSIIYDPFSSNSYCVGFDATGGCPGAGSPCFGGPNQGVAPWLALYPRMFLMPTGLIYASSMREQLFLLDPSTGMWTHIGQSSLGQFRDYGTSILLPLQNSSSERGKVMVVGGSSTDISPATNIVEIHDFNQGTATSPSIRTVASLLVGRKFLLPIILPNGKVAVFGGTSQGNNIPVFVPEMFDPENESQGWVQLPSATVPRHYHGTALLLPDGSVWTAGGTPDAAVWELRIEIFRPSYFFSATPRPAISASPTVGDYGASITIPTPDAANISRVSLVKTGCTTHHYDIDMRLVWLPITSRTSNSVTVSAPINGNIAPPGHYMIHVLDSSLVPSTARIIKIPGTGSGGDTTPPVQVTGLSATTVSSTQINLGWTANTETDLNHYNVYRGTTAGFVVTPGTTVPIATPTTNSYSNTGLSPSTTYYYKVAAVDNAGNIGALSNEVSGTTSTGTTAWSSWESLGIASTGIVNNAAVTQNTDGRLEAFVVGGDTGLWHKWQTAAGSSTWSAYDSLGGGIRAGTTPAVARNSDDRLEVFVIGANNQLYHKWQTAAGSSTWSGWSPLEGGIKSNTSPAVARNSDDRLEVFVIGANNQLYHKWQTAAGSSTWTQWQSLGGGLRNGSNPALIANSDDRLEVFVIGANNQLYHKWQTAAGSSTWSGWSPLEGGIKSNTSPAVARNSDGRLEVFVVGTNNALYHKWQTAAGSSSSWSAYQWLAGGIKSNTSPAVARNSDGRLEVFVVGTNNALYHKWQTAAGSSTWSSWESLNVVSTGIANSPALAINSDGRLEAFVIGSGDNGLWHRWQI